MDGENDAKDDDDDNDGIDDDEDVDDDGDGVEDDDEDQDGDGLSNEGILLIVTISRKNALLQPCLQQTWACFFWTPCSSWCIILVVGDSCKKRRRRRIHVRD